MKTAVGLFGIHYVQRLNHWMGWKHGVDFEKTVDVFKNQILKNLNPKYFISTYKSEKISNLMKAYYPHDSVLAKNLDNKMDYYVNSKVLFAYSLFDLL